MAANIYNSTAPNNSPPSYHPQEPTSDDVSLFLQQIILRSNSSPASSSSNTPLQPFAAFSDLGSGAFSNSGQISVPNPNHSSSRFALAAANGPPSSIVRFDNESDDYDYESEEVAEAVVEEMTARATPPCRRSSKRSRSAQVHNQSEKRRRSRINEKMKALQNLIPNSNKTDKASMLDDAIEYLKQLQLQVQMLTMKNGLSLHANCVPETLLQQPNDQYTSQVRMEGNETIYMDHQNISADPLIRLQDKCTNKKSTPARVTDFSCMIAPKTSVKIESESTVAQRIPYQRPSSSKEKVRICQPSSEDCLRTSSTGAKAITLIPCETNTSKMNDTTLEAHLAGGDHLLQNFVNHPMFSSHSSM